MEPANKNSKREEEGESEVIPGLPHSVALECLDRVPRLLHPHLAAVSKPWLFHFFTQRFCHPTVSQSDGLPTGYVYVRLFFNNGEEKFWAWNVQHKVCLPLPPFPLDAKGKYTVVRGRLFSIGSFLDNSPDVCAYDPFINRWDSCSPMKVSRHWPTVATIGGKIYVLGGCDGENPNWAEVYDPTVDQWTSLSIPSGDLGGKICRICVVANGKLFGLCYEGLGFVFDPTSSPSLTTVSREVYGAHPNRRINTLFAKWDPLRGAAVVKGILFTYFQGKLRGYDFENHQWNVLQGIGSRLRTGLSRASLVNIQEKLCVIRKMGTDLSFACLDIYKHEGLPRCKILWCHSVVTTTRPCNICECLSISESYGSDELTIMQHQVLSV